MSSPRADRVVAEALDAGGAFLKVVQPNDVGVTGGHQKGFHLSKQVWSYFTPQEPTKGMNHDHPVRVEWADRTITDSVIKWYGTGTRSEYRMTSFNRIRNFTYLRPERLGGVLVLVVRSGASWFADIVESDEDIDHVTASLGVSLDDSSWALFTAAGRDSRSGESTDECERLAFEREANRLTAFPSTKVMSELAQDIVASCWTNGAEPIDDLLLHLVRAEYDLFKAVERRLVMSEIARGFDSVDDFVRTAGTITNRRKSRAGHALENHFEHILRRENIAFESQPIIDETKPDILMPGSREYHDLTFDVSGLRLVGVKTTCKDRWRQVLSEGRRPGLPRFILTLQKGVSTQQMKEMRDNHLTLVVPRSLHEHFAPDDRRHLVGVADFLAQV